MGLIGGKYDTYLQDQNTPPIRYFLMNEEKTDIALTSPIAIDDSIINVSTGHGITGGKWLTIFNGNFYIQVQVVSVATNAITIDRPSAYSFAVSGTVIVRGVVNMNVDASSTPYTFQCLLRTFNSPIHFNKIITILQHTADSDDSKFGGITALTNGVYLRKNNSPNQSFGLYKSNSDFREYGGLIEYTSKAPAGGYATNVTTQLNGQTGYGVILEIDNKKGDSFKAVIRDNLSTLVKFRIVLIGHYTLNQ